jgi:predicted nucleic acid-binding protein
MPMKPKLYLDTSVFTAAFDERKPARRQMTLEFWELLGHYQPCTSRLAREELDWLHSEQERATATAMLRNVDTLEITPAMTALARRYVEVGVFGPLFLRDALHVAACVMSRQEILVSWNFKHLVNRRKRFLINETSAASDLARIEILCPPEL